MILNRQQTRWAWHGRRRRFSLAVYIVYAVLASQRAARRLPWDCFLPVGTGIIVFECLLGLRKSTPHRPWGG